MVVALAVALLVSGCKVHPGGKCSVGAAACLDKTSGLFCGADGKYAIMSCRGGCTTSGRDVNCESSIASENDGCGEVGNVACSIDHSRALECGKDNKFIVGETCRGPRGCTVVAGSIDCDNDTSEVGDPCHAPGDYACTQDKALLLRCNDRKMAPRNACRGPKGCRVVERTREKKIDFLCDDSVAKEGDPCDTNGEETCALDKTAMYICQANAFVAYKTCTGPAGCTYDEPSDHYACDEGHVAAPVTPSATSPATVKKPMPAAPTNNAPPTNNKKKKK